MAMSTIKRAIYTGVFTVGLTACVILASAASKKAHASPESVLAPVGGALACLYLVLKIQEM